MLGDGFEKKKKTARCYDLTALKLPSPTAFGFLRRASKPIKPRPVTKSEIVAGSGVTVWDTTPSADPPSILRNASQLEHSQDPPTIQSFSAVRYPVGPFL